MCTIETRAAAMVKEILQVLVHVAGAPWGASETRRADLLAFRLSDLCDSFGFRAHIWPLPWLA